MANSKIELASGEVLLDLTSDTITADKLVSGYTAHDKSGEAITGTLKTITVYSSATAPDSSVGDNGDIWLEFESN